MYGSTRPQSAPMGRGTTQNTNNNGGIIPSLNNNGGNGGSTSSNPMANRPIGRPSSAIAHLRLATALQQQQERSSSPANNNNNNMINGAASLSSSTAAAPSKLLRPQSAAIAGRYLPPSTILSSSHALYAAGLGGGGGGNSRPSSAKPPTYGGNSSGNQNASGGGVSFYEGLVEEADESLSMNNISATHKLQNFNRKNNQKNNAAAEDPVSSEDAAAIASLKGEIMLLQRVLETVEEFDFAFPAYPSSRNNTPRGGGGGGGYQPVQFASLTAENKNDNNGAFPAATVSSYQQQQQHAFPTPSAELQVIEQQLIAIQPSMLSDQSVAEAKIALLELLIERLKAVSVAALRKCDVNAAELRVMPSRVSGFTTLVKYVMEIAERKRSWEYRMRAMNGNGNEYGGGGGDDVLYHGIVPTPPITSGMNAASAVSMAAAVNQNNSNGRRSPRRAAAAANAAVNAAASAAQQQQSHGASSPMKIDGRVMDSVAATHPITLMDLALNEPTMTEIQHLIAEQKQLQASLKKLLQQPQLQQQNVNGAKNAAAGSSLIAAGGDAPIHEAPPAAADTVTAAAPPPSAPAAASGKKGITGGKGSASASPANKRGSVSGGKGGAGGANAALLDPVRVQHMETQLKLKTAELHAATDKNDEFKKEIAALKKAKDDAEKELAAVKAKEIAQFIEFESEWAIRNKVAAVALVGTPSTAMMGAAGITGPSNSGSLSPSANNNNSLSLTVGLLNSTVGFGGNSPPSPTSNNGGGFTRSSISGSAAAAALLNNNATTTASAVSTALQPFFSNLSADSVPARLVSYGLPREMLIAPSLSDAEAAVFLSKIQQVFAESIQFVSENNNSMKGRKAIKTMQDDITSQQNKQQTIVNNSSAERQNLLNLLAAGGNSAASGSSGGGGPNNASANLTANSVANSKTPRVSLSASKGGSSLSAADGSISASSLTASIAGALSQMGISNVNALVPLLPRSEALDGATWAALHRQNAIIHRLCDIMDENTEAQENAKMEWSNESDRLNRIIKSLEERIDGLKVTTAKLKQSHEQLEYEFEERNRPEEGKEHVFTTAADKVRIVQTKNQPMTAAEREKDLHRTIQAKDKKIENITDQLRSSKHEIDDKAAEIASMSRERISLLSKCSEESLKVQALQKQLEEAYQIRQSTQDSAQTMKRELREKTVLEADNAQKLWKSQVELHIAHNVISELRKREQQLLDDLEDAVEQRKILREQHENKTMENRKMQTMFELQLQEARASVDAAKASLHQERQQMLANEKEMERLRVVDVQLETMEQNFNNYAVSMIVKREASEEEERVLGECLQQIQEDVFTLPDEVMMGEEQLTLLLAKLMHRKEVLENETRINKQAEVALLERKRLLASQTSSTNGGGATSGIITGPNLRDGPSDHDKEKSSIATAEEKLSNKRRLGLLLQRRYTDIQIFACERRLAEVRRGMQLRETITELNSVQQVHEAMLKELSQTRSQLDAMAQRNSELEVERKQLIKDREREETSNKKLMAQVQRLNVTSEVQEGMLVDLGTKLQNEKIAATSPLRGGRSLLSGTQSAFGNTANNNNKLSASQSSQMTISNQTVGGGAGLAVSGNFGGDVNELGMTGNNSNISSVSNPHLSHAAGQKGGAKRQYNIAPLGPVL